MHIEINTPALLFPAISLLLLPHTPARPTSIIDTPATKK
jgi:hypothetical protein